MKKHLYIMVMIFVSTMGIMVGASAMAAEKVDYEVRGSLNTPKFELRGDRQQFVVSNSILNVGKNYMLTEKYKAIKGKNYRFNSDKEYYKVGIINIDKPTDKKILDLSKIANNYKKGYVYENFFVKTIQNEDYLVLILSNGKKLASKKFKYFSIAYNLRTGKVSQLTDISKEFNSEIVTSYNKKGYFSDNDPLSEPLYRTGITGSLDNDNLWVGTTLSIGRNYTDNINLFTQSAGFGLDRVYHKDTYIYPRQTLVTPEEWFNDILHWFAPVGQDHLTTHLAYASDEEYSIPINSYADYLKVVNGKS